MNGRPKFRLVENCPQPEPPAYKPIVYGAAPWSKLPPSPPADELAIRARAQSLLSKDGKRAEFPDLATALRVLERWNKPKRVTVPENAAKSKDPDLRLIGERLDATAARQREVFAAHYARAETTGVLRP